MVYLNIYFIGIIGIAGKGPNWREPFNPDKTIGEIVKSLKDNGFGENNKSVKILKHKPGCLDKFDDINNPYWSDNSTLLEYVNYYGGINGTDVMMIYVLI